MGNPIVVNLLCDLEQAESGTDIIKAMDGYDNLMALVNQGQP